MTTSVYLQALAFTIGTIHAANAAEMIDITTKIYGKSHELLGETTVQSEIGRKTSASFEKGRERFTLDVVAAVEDEKSCYRLDLFLERLEPATQSKQQTKTVVRVCEGKTTVFEGGKFGAPSLDISVAKTGGSTQR